ncbi:sacsin N-terminal ATP-binding-like domain-containing protein [Rhodococcus sp. NPDC058514]|uniref:sacsin N-terminal ATP-binding-like domain-containing protein n=1 Tax=unclassified Rhodococcus (in: high G+C Gram-positive bacteria) TaxID=192944 RepID=UPI00365A58DC
MRESTLLAWRSSPTRLREDTATEADLAVAGYRDRLLTELAQNAADAAARAGVPGAMRIRLDGTRLHVANTGAPLDRAGVQALAALRVSGKDTDGGPGVGRFGVGFTAVLSVSDEIELRSTTGSIAFSANRTRDELGNAGLEEPERGLPVLRLVWPIDARPAPGFDSEVVLALRPGVDGDRLLRQLAADAPDLLLELPALTSIELADESFTRSEKPLADGLTELCVRVAPQAPLLPIDGRTWWQYSTGPSARWLVPVEDGRVRPVTADVLRAPTRSDEELSLPAILIADAALQPDRRRLMPGAALAHLSDGYADFVAALPESQRLRLVPVPGFARGEVDAVLREAVLRELTANPWLPGADGRSLVPSSAVVLPGLTAELADLLLDVIPGLLGPGLSTERDAQPLSVVGAHRIGLAHLTELLAGIHREPDWWGRLYAALEPLVVDSVAAEELAAIPVPLTDGRTVTGPRTVVLGHDLGTDVHGIGWMRLVHPGAAHRLLARLGAGNATALDVLSDPALLSAIEEVDLDDHTAAHELADSVLPLAAAVSATGELPGWLGRLPLPDADGTLRGADELLLPGAPLSGVLAADSPFGTVSSALVERYGEAALRGIGVGWGFTVLRSELPTGPEQDLDDEDAWWSTLADDPEVLLAVRDLDLVDSDAWPDALGLLAAEPSTAALLADRNGYTAWWLRRHARLGGVRLGALRRSDDRTFEGLLDVLDHRDAAALSGVLATDRVDGVEMAELLLDRLADRDRDPSPAVVARTHRLLAEATASGVLDLDELSPPAAVRTLSGTLADPAEAVVLDRAWMAAAVPPELLVVGDLPSAAGLAELLDLPPASEVIRGEVLGAGRRVSAWDREPAAVLAHVALGLPLPDGTLVVHDRLTVRLSGAVQRDVELPWWVDEDGRTHCTENGFIPAIDPSGGRERPGAD